MTRDPYHDDPALWSGPLVEDLRLAPGRPSVETLHRRVIPGAGKVRWHDPGHAVVWPDGTTYRLADVWLVLTDPAGRPIPGTKPSSFVHVQITHYVRVVPAGPDPPEESSR